MLCGGRWCQIVHTGMRATFHGYGNYLDYNAGFGRGMGKVNESCRSRGSSHVYLEQKKNCLKLQAYIKSSFLTKNTQPIKD